MSALQEAHEQEVATYVSNVTPLREQLEMQQLTISTLQEQLLKTKQELAVTSIDRDELCKRSSGKEVPFLPRSSEKRSELEVAGHHSTKCEQVCVPCLSALKYMLVCYISAVSKQT